MSSAAAKSEKAEPSSVSSRLNASQAKPAPSAKAAMCTTRKNPVGRSLIQLPQGMCSSLVLWCRRSWCQDAARPYPSTVAGEDAGAKRGPALRSVSARAGVYADEGNPTRQEINDDRSRDRRPLLRRLGEQARRLRRRPPRRRLPVLGPRRELRQ